MDKAKNISLIFFVIIIFPSIVISGDHSKIPNSTRAQNAISKVSPILNIELAKRNLRLGNSIFIRIFKEEKQLEMWVECNGRYVLFKSYPICTYGYGGLGPKIKQGDCKAPEGFYYVKSSSLNPYSKFHLSFNLGYPNRYDRIHKRTGSALMVHGSCVSIGCYAVTDRIIEEIYTFADAALKNEQNFFRVHIFPFKMNQTIMKKHEKSRWYIFWSNLKEGYDFFEENGNIPPNVEVKNRRYVFNK